MIFKRVFVFRKCGPHPVTRALPPLVLAISAAMLASACSPTEPVVEKAGQVAARVDGTEISVHQINHLLARANAGADNPETAKALRKQVLDKLVDQQLLVLKAQADKLDRTPDVQLALDAARREALANAYLQQYSASKPKPGETEVHRYYVEHPELFSQRRVFELQELNFSAKTPAETLEAITAMSVSGVPLEQMVAFLNARGVVFGRTDSQRASEQISLELLPRLYKVKAGQSLVASSPKTVSVVYLKGWQEAATSEVAALPRVAQFLSNQALSQALDDVIKSLRSKARIEYVGEFAAAEAETAAPK